MYLRKTPGRRTAVLPDGSILTLADLPDANTRWVARRKATVVRAIQHGLLAREDALERYGLTGEELDGWMKAVEGPGIDALKVTSLQRYRPSSSGFTAGDHSR
ncbi:DUF1153 domain-containing protein [Paracoccus sp. Z118]|uniref:CtrA inhibitor SciP n=1 Tax=Paracoccus sp. Z118 TaxID=2851017 RepID=UPI001C2BBA22|nr:DUF1153 domain-containing protein [Paracoccus sp. Z118]MBV0890427.1 DUF1153 domain-containing protein [Paracoccus sp. Z118]